MIAGTHLPISISKEWLVLVPLCGSGLAAIYDVGYFSGVGMNFFTFFSITEHIVFALAILPVAILATIVLGSLTYLMDIRARRAHEKNAIRHVYRSAAYGILALALAMVLASYFFVAPSLLDAAFSIAFGLTAFGIAVSQTPMIKFIWSVIFVTGFFYSTGLIVALSQTDRDKSTLDEVIDKLRPNHNRYQRIELIDGDMIDARILRSGDRGILYFDPKSNHVTLLQWRGVSKIIRVLP